MSNQKAEQLSLAFQFVASFCWTIGAILAGPSSAADFLQLFAAVAWCLANVASAWGMRTQCCGSSAAMVPAKNAQRTDAYDAKGEQQEVAMAHL